jgi:ACS family tartrate transporter-like MFS transporter
MLADGPAQARWLTPPERDHLARLVSDGEAAPVAASGRLARLVRDPRLWTLMALFFAVNFTVYGLSYWMPLVFRSAGFSLAQIGWVAALPGLVGCVAMVLWTRRSDRRGERLGHLAAPMAAAGLAAIGAGLALAWPPLAVAAICAAVAATVTAVAMLWILPALTLPAEDRAVGVGLVTAAGAAAGLVSPWLVGVLRERTGDFAAALMALGVPILAASLLPPTLRAAARTGAPTANRNPQETAR